MQAHTKGIEKDRKEELDKICSICDGRKQSEVDAAANQLAQVGGNYILSSFDLKNYRQVNREGAFQLLICVGVEILLNAIVILKSPENFSNCYKRKGQPLLFDQAKGLALKIIKRDIGAEKRERMADVLDLIHSKRNIFAHVSLSFHAYYYHHFEILNVLEFLYSQYFPTQRAVILEIHEMKMRFRPKGAHDIVEFLPVSVGAA